MLVDKVYGIEGLDNLSNLEMLNTEQSMYSLIDLYKDFK